ncbi:TolC family protein [Desulfopila aestuarii]|uniref:Outer membrane protein TolC n=1 Tax=Desulfopila aestuarii DSM 18488 TaxID=1121416 RepID=A0A1M7Y4T1_9BACT|nr:TolC family protein [Desulfopila aestuarii]SHO47150.1 Outer membrane protein TolC [Desulfopila aestuarii DSM 18488]
MKIVSILACGVLLGSAVQAAELADMQKMAIENRAVVQRYITAVEKSEKDVTIAKGAYYPSVDISYIANSLDDTNLSNLDSENSIASGRVSWNIFSGFRDKYNLATAEQLREVENQRLAAIRQDIQLNVALSYLYVFDRKANLRVSEDAYKTLEQFYRDGENRFEVGLIGKNELLKFRVDYDNADITMKAAQATLDTSVNTLSREVGTEITLPELIFAEFDKMPKELDEEAYRQKMLSSRSEIKALEGLIGASDSQIQAAYSDYYPKVDLVGSYSNYDDNYVNGAGDNSEDELRAQMVLSMNLFRGFTKEAKTSKAKLEKRQLQYDLQELKDTFTNDLRNIFIDYRISLANVEVARRSIEQAQENLRITRLKYEEGLQRESDLLDAITNLSRAQANEVAVVRTVYLNYFRITRMVDGF